MRRAVLALVVGMVVGGAWPVLAATGGSTVTVVHVGAGGVNGCAVLADSTVRCWGGNRLGQLGNGSTTDSPVPVTVKNSANTGALTGVVHVAVGPSFACALLRSGSVQCWGDNTVASLGQGSTTGPNTCSGGSPCSTLPVTVKNSAGSGALVEVAQIAVGGGQACALLSNGNVQCWGVNLTGELGNGSSTGPSVCGAASVACATLPVAVKNSAGTGVLGGAAQVVAGNLHTCARLSDGTVQCWGANDRGELGRGSIVGPQTCDPTACSTLPVTVKNSAGNGVLSGVTALGTGATAQHTCARLNNGTSQCWGANNSGQLGNGTTTGPQSCSGTACSTLPVVTKNGAGTGPLLCVVDVTGGDKHSCATIVDGTARCWGANNVGQLGNGSTAGSSLPTNVKNSAGTGLLTNVNAVVGGSDHTCAQLVSGTAACWGHNNLGQLGNNSNVNSSLPVTVQ